MSMRASNDEDLKKKKRKKKKRKKKRNGGVCGQSERDRRTDTQRQPDR